MKLFLSTSAVDTFSPLLLSNMHLTLPFTLPQGVAEQESRRAADAAEAKYHSSFRGAEDGVVAEEGALAEEHEVGGVECGLLFD